MSHPALLAVRRVALPLLLAGCTVTPTRPIPAPLPEAEDWASVAEGQGAFLGLKTRENLAGGFDALDFQPGLRVTQVVERSPAALAGCEPGDVLLSFGGRATDDPETLEALLAETKAETKVLLEVQRGDTVFEVSVLLGERDGGGPSGAEPVRRLDPARSRAGWRTDRGGARLVASHEDAPFPAAGVPLGSLVTALDGEPVGSARSLIRALEQRAPGSRVEVAFQDPEGAERTSTVTLQDQPTQVTRFSIPILMTYDADVEGERTSFVLLDLWLLSLLRYEREGEERRWRFLRFFQFSTGVGELTE